MKFVTLILRMRSTPCGLASLYLRLSLRLPELADLLIGCCQALRELRRLR